MTYNTVYQTKRTKLCRGLQRRHWICIFLISFLFRAATGYCQTDKGFEEVSVIINIREIGNLEIEAIIHGEVVYLPVKEVFDFLKIKNTASPDLDTLSGFIIHPKSVFIVDKPNHQIVYQEKITKLTPEDLLRRETGLYLKSDYYGTVFGLGFVFDFRSLSLRLNTLLELPAIREMQQQQMRSNLSQLKGEKIADTIIGRSYSIFQAGMADWSVMSMQQTNGKDNTRASLGLGAMVLGGEANVFLNYNNSQPLSMAQQYYHWRYVDNNNPLLRQVTAGKLFPQSISSIFVPVTGIQLTNSPTTYRRSFGTYNVSYYTEPGWMVELYINNVLVDYTKADGSGLFTFEVPVVYGNSLVKFRYYGPWGEERTREQHISIPFNLLPPHELEYSLTAGIVGDDLRSRFSRATISYGLSSHITIGGGMEFLSSVTSGRYIPFVNASLRIGTNLLVSGEYAYGVRYKGVMNYRLPSSLQLDVYYIKYDKSQTAVRYNFLEEQKAVISRPFRGKKFTAFSRLTLNRFKLFKYKQTSAEFLISGVYAGISSNLTTFAIFTDPAHPLVFSNLSLTFRLPKGIRFTPQVQYEYREQNFSMLRGEMEKCVFKNGYLNMSYERDLIRKARYAGMGLRYNFSFAQTFFGIRTAGNLLQMTQAASGSLMYNDQSGKIRSANRPNVGRGGLVLSPFLDLNCNGLREKNEPKAAGLKLRINGGHIERNERDTTLQVSNLESYVNYHIDLQANNFDNIAWQLQKKSLSVAVEPNHFRHIDIPISVVGEVSGTVYLQGKNLAGLSRIIVNIYNSNAVLVSRVITEADGYFSYLGLAPGKYSAVVDKVQLLKLKMVSSPVNAVFTIKSSKEGDVAEGLKFVLQSIDITEEEE